MNIKDLNDIQQWATQQWGQAELGDARRNQRAIQIGAEIAAKPEASLPEQMANWGDLKAAYRLLGQFDVTHTALSQPHWQNTRGQASVTDAAVVLFVQDSSELDYTHHNKTKNLGHIGNGKGKGLLLHSCLAVIPRPEHPPGIIHSRREIILSMSWARKRSAMVRES